MPDTLVPTQGDDDSQHAHAEEKYFAEEDE
jgi:hypothetical protein